MSYMKTLMLDIIELFDSGLDSEQVAFQLNCDIKHVYDTIEFFYGQNQGTLQ